MQITTFHAHYQSVYTNFDFSSFSLISCNKIFFLLHSKMGEIDLQIRPFWSAISPKLQSNLACFALGGLSPWHLY